ncbi:MAG: hypothetical protein Q4F56_01695 [Candidatus Saccharibacteria bacterium]|nr:hypothetical protein [Candidatus Saccharibacteria bacterium]
MDNQSISSPTYGQLTPNNPETRPQHPDQPHNSQPKSPLIPIIICATLAIVGIGFGILNTIQIAQLNSSLDTSGIFEDEAGDTPENISIECVLPSSADDIDYLYLSYNEGTTQFFVDKADSITYYNETTNSSNETTSDQRTVNTSTASIFQQVFNNGLNDFSSYSSPDDETASVDISTKWLAQIDNSDYTTCQASGNDTPPSWFTALLNTLKTKIEQ